MSVIITIFGILYFLFRCASDKADGIIAKERAKEELARESAWRAKVTNPKLEQELILFIKRPENHDAVQAETKEVYDLLLAGKPIDELFPRELWPKKAKYHTPEFAELLVRDNEYSALRIMMAKRGYMIESDARTLRYGGIATLSRIDAMVLVWCAKELKKHGIDEPLVLPSPEIGLYGPIGLYWDISGYKPDRVS